MPELGEEEAVGFRDTTQGVVAPCINGLSQGATTLWVKRHARVGRQAHRQGGQEGEGAMVRALAFRLADVGTAMSTVLFKKDYRS